MYKEQDQRFTPVIIASLADVNLDTPNYYKKVDGEDWSDATVLRVLDYILVPVDKEISISITCADDIVDTGNITFQTAIGKWDVDPTTLNYADPDGTAVSYAVVSDATINPIVNCFKPGTWVKVAYDGGATAGTLLSYKRQR